jgi:Fe-S-cluster containining protein
MLRDAVMQAAKNPEIRAAVARVYADLQREIDARKPVCNASGRCCRFEEFGHRLYVTTIELAAFVAGLSDGPTHANPGGCPFQVDGLCSVHPIRPFSCRVFFCDSTSDEWQRQQYERFHGELKRLHEEFAVPYRYVEWRDALRQLDLPRVPLAVSRIDDLEVRETASGNRPRLGPKTLSLPQLPF